MIRTASIGRYVGMSHKTTNKQTNQIPSKSNSPAEFESATICLMVKIAIPSVNRPQFLPLMLIDTFCSNSSYDNY